MASAGSLTPAIGSRAATDGRSSTDTAISVVVPTRNEAGNVDALLDRLGPALAGSSAEVIFVDDSDDDTPQRVLDRAATSPPDLVVRLLHRPPGQRAGGLGTAVVAGFTAATGEWVVVMDGDLQHPPEVVPQLVERGEQSGAGIVVASRKVEGGDDEGLSGTSRVLVSGGATLLAKVVFPRRLQGVSDPMSGFFAVRRSSLDTSRLRPDGFKILMEVLVRTPGLDPVEVGFAFQDRNAGESKASLAEGMRFARHLATLSLSRLRPARLSPRTSMTGRALAFGAVGLSGIAVNSLVMFLLADPVALGLNYLAAAIIATQVSTTWNYLLTDRLVYGGPKRLGAARRYLAFLITNNVLLLLRIPVLALLVGSLGMHYLAANLLTLVLTFIARFATSDRLIFHKGATS
jgi:glycosyltransferase involved in cell wall biosynthesis